MILDCFAGPGGWDEGLAGIGRTDVLGIEWDKAACATAAAAGHARLWADVASLDPRDVVAAFGPCEGLIASPPCQAWSMAGKQLGELDRANCHYLADRMATGDDTLNWTAWEDERSPLVCQPVRWVRELRPEWVALEEVPAVASLWQHFARIFRAWGYSVWSGDLCSADYGVPQTRTRRILMAHRIMLAQPPEPTHCEGGAQRDLFGEELAPWVSMAEALGWRANYKRTRGRGMLERHGDRDSTQPDEPAPTINACADYESAPDGTITSTGDGLAWVYDRPAFTLTGFDLKRCGVQGSGKDYAEARENAVRITVQEAGILQSFPADYPWEAAGSRTKAFQCVGNAIPPRLAAHILAALGVGQLPIERAA